MRTTRFRLGAEELIELGDGKVGVDLDRKPFLAGRIGERSPVKKLGVFLQLGASKVGAGNMIDMLGDVAPYLSDRLDMALAALSEIANTPIGALSANVETAISKLSGLLERIPSLQNLAAQILAIGGVFSKYGLSIPELRLRNLGNVLAALGMSMKKMLGEKGLQSKINQAKKAIADQGTASLKEAVATVLDSAGVSGNDPAPHVDLASGLVTPEPVGTGLV